METSAVPPTAAPSATAAARNQAREFEAVFAGEVAKLMLESVAVDDSFGGGHGEQLFRGIMAEELGKSIAAGGGIGLAPAVLDQILKLQGHGA